MLYDCAKRFTDRPFISIAETGETYSYAEFEILTNRLAHGMRKRFGDDLDYVAIVLENSVEYLAMTYALKKIDTVEVSVNRAMRSAPLARMIDQTKAPVLFTSGQHLEALRQIRNEIPHVNTLVMLDKVVDAKQMFPELEVIEFDALLAEQSDHIVSPARDTDTAAILFTSGTTGVSKGCILSHRYAVRTAENMMKLYRWASQGKWWYDPASPVLWPMGILACPNARWQVAAIFGFRRVISVAWTRKGVSTLCTGSASVSA